MNNVFIPSRGRWQGARELTDIWHENGFNVHWVVEPSEHDQYFDELTIPYSGAPKPGGLTTKVHLLTHNNLGIGNSRNQCVWLADSYDYKSIILADDDIKPAKKNANMKELIECAEHDKVLGITARYSYHDLCLGSDNIRGRSDLILLPTGTFRLVGLNVQNVMALGNYDQDLEYAEDCDLFLRGLKAGYPWMCHLGTWSNSIGTRYAPGGLADYVTNSKDQMQHKKLLWHQILHSKYPEVVNDPTKIKDWAKQNTIRIYWKRAYDLWLPDWNKWSMLHGGYLAYYLGYA